MAYPNIYNDPKLLNIKNNADQLRELQYKTEKHDHENILKSLTYDNDYDKKNYKSLTKKKELFFVTEVLIWICFNNNQLFFMNHQPKYRCCYIN